MYGRACTLYPRSLELLDQYDLLDVMKQPGYVAKGAVNYKNGKRVTQRGWSGIFTQLGETYFQWILNLRLKYSEDIFRGHYVEKRGQYVEGYELKSHQIRQGQEYPVEAEIQEISSGQCHIIEAYIASMSMGIFVTNCSKEIPRWCRWWTLRRPNAGWNLCPTRSNTLLVGTPRWSNQDRHAGF